MEREDLLTESDEPIAVQDALEAAPKPQRLLACDRCHRRKIKCNRKSPCSNCIAVKSHCEPTTRRQTQRRRRLPGRDLLERLQYYEHLLQQNHIAFENSQQDSATVPCSKEDSSVTKDFPGRDTENKAGEVELSSKAPASSLHEKLNLWTAADPKSQPATSDDDSLNDNSNERDFSKGKFTNDSTMQKALDHYHQDANSYLLHFVPDPTLDLMLLRPERVELFKLWQIYVDNVDPLLKVTHTPSLQASIVNATSDMGSMKSSMQALVLSICCVALLSLTDEECSATFGLRKTDLMTKCQIGCQQALLRCGYLRSDDRSCLTALYLYVISIKPYVDRRSLCTMLGSVIRIAQRMGIHDEATNAKCAAFEAEMRRRLWWSLLEFDTRVCEMSNNLQSAMLIPTWSCRPPSNINDSQIRVGMKSLPPPSDVPTDSLHVVVRSTIAQCLRHCDFQLAFINPALKTTNSTQKNTMSITDDDLTTLQNGLNEDYFKNCDLDNPLHFITVWTARSQLSRARLLKHYWTNTRPGMDLPEAQLDAATSHALDIIKCETKLMSSSAIKGYLWHISRFYFPAYIHVLKDLKNRPNQASTEEAWTIMSNDFKARFEEAVLAGNPVFQLLSNLVVEAWEARKTAGGHFDTVPDLSQIVSDAMRSSIALTSSKDESNMLQPDEPMGIDLDDFLPIPMDFDYQEFLDGMAQQLEYHERTMD